MSKADVIRAALAEHSAAPASSKPTRKELVEGLARAAEALHAAYVATGLVFVLDEVDAIRALLDREGR